MTQNKTGFLTGLNGSKNAVVYYQCKSCSSFLASTSKWDRHLSKCFSKSIGDGAVSRPVGFRMVSFTVPYVSLERIAHERTDLSGATSQVQSSPLATTIVPKKRGRGRPRKIISSGSTVEKTESSAFPDPLVEYNKPNASSETTPEQDTPTRKRGRGRPRKIISSGSSVEKKELSIFPDPLVEFKHNASFETTSQQDTPTRKRGRPRKVVIPLKTSDDQATPSLESTEDDNIIRKSRRPKKERNYLEVSVDEKRFKHAKSKKRALIKGQLQTKRGRGRPPKFNETGRIIQPKAKKVIKKSSSAFFKAARRQHVRTKDDVVRKYKLSCHLCPGKFQIERDLRIHVNIHNGNRRLMECIVCRRIFNKRDSLNQHYCSHEAAEAREEKFNLFQPWDDALLEKVKTYRNHYKSNNFNRQQTCKACLLHHYSHYSFRTHFITEHANPPESYTLTCKFENCQEQFKSIRVYLDHAKKTHPEKFYGKLTLFRQDRGIFIGNRVAYVSVNSDNGNRNVPTAIQRKQQGIPMKSVKKKKVVAPNFAKRVSRFTPLEINDNDDCSDWEEECGISQRELARNEVDDESDVGAEEMTPLTRNIEVERVHLHEMGVKKEANVCRFVENVKPESSEEIIVPDLLDPDTTQENSNGVGFPFPVESVPVAFGVVKGENDLLMELD